MPLENDFRKADNVLTIYQLLKKYSLIIYSYLNLNLNFVT